MSKSKNDKIHIFCDMDGVLVNFLDHFIEYKGYDIRTIKKHESYKIISSLPIEWWETIPWMKDSKILWKYLSDNFINLNILSSPSSDKQQKSRKGKIKWLKKEGIFDQIGEDNCIIAENKHHYIVDGEISILIDDTPKKINSWIKAGGIGILHKTASETIESLLYIIKRIKV